MYSVAVEDSTLELMTQSLLQISSVFLVQQNELQEVRDRLQKELARVSRIQETLSTAAQQHQDAVLSVIQNYENLATGAHANLVKSASIAGPRLSTSSGKSIEEPRAQQPKAVRQLHLPPVALEVGTFYPKKNLFEEDEGIKYVDKLQVVGGILGRPMVATAEFVGTPSVQWLRQHPTAGKNEFTPIEGATELTYMPTADDVGAIVRVECVGPYGGDTVAVETPPVALDPATHAELMSLFGRGHAEFNAHTQQQEPRILLVTRKNIKVRNRLSRLVTTATTLYKQGYDQTLTVSVMPHAPNELELRLGTHTFQLVMDSTKLRDLAVICIRMFAGPNCPTHADREAPALTFAESQRSEPMESSRRDETPGRQSSVISIDRHSEEGEPKWSDDEGEGEGEEFKPAIKISMRSKEDALVADPATLKSFSLSLAPPKAPPKAASRSRGKLVGTPNKSKIDEEEPFPAEPQPATSSGFDDSFGLATFAPSSTTGPRSVPPPPPPKLSSFDAAPASAFGGFGGDTMGSSFGGFGDAPGSSFGGFGGDALGTSFSATGGDLPGSSFGGIGGEAPNSSFDTSGGDTRGSSFGDLGGGALSNSFANFGRDTLGNSFGGLGDDSPRDSFDAPAGDTPARSFDGFGDGAPMTSFGDPGGDAQGNSFGGFGGDVPMTSFDAPGGDNSGNSFGGFGGGTLGNSFGLASDAPNDSFDPLGGDALASFGNPGGSAADGSFGTQTEDARVRSFDGLGGDIMGTSSGAQVGDKPSNSFGDSGLGNSFDAVGGDSHGNSFGGFIGDGQSNMFGGGDPPGSFGGGGVFAANVTEAAPSATAVEAAGDSTSPPSEIVSFSSAAVGMDESGGGSKSAHAADAQSSLLILEVVNAHLRGKHLLQYQVVGELRANVSPGFAGTEFKFRLKNAHRIEQLKANDKFVKTTQAGEYEVSLPAVTSTSPPSFPLIKYIATARWRPVPIFVNASVEELSPTEGRVIAAAETNPQLKMPLQNVSIKMPSLPASVSCEPDFQGAWDSELRELQWSIPQLFSKDKPVVCTASFSCDDGAASSIRDEPVLVHFDCEGVTISGIELEAQMGEAGQPVAKLNRRFVAGDYKVSFDPQPEASS